MVDNSATKLIKRSVPVGVLFGIVVVIVLLAAGLISTRLAHAASSGQNCDNNAVVYCGVTSVAGVIGKYNNGDGLNTATSIHNIYDWFGISSSDIQSMGSTAQAGSVTSSGDVYVGNQLVATNALTGGRQNIQPGSTERDDQGTIFYTRPPSVSFLSSPLSAYVVMKNGVFQFAILTSCGNPVIGTPKTPPPAPTPTPTPTPTPPAPQPSPPAATPAAANVCSGDTNNANVNGVASQGGDCSTNTTVVNAPANSPQTPPSGQCTGLAVAVNQDNPLAVTAGASYQVAGGAQLQSITYDFGDNSSVPATNQTTITHTYQQSGSYTVNATLTFSGSQTVAPSTCQALTTVTSPPPPPATTSSAPVATTTSATTPAPAPTQTPSTQLVNTGPGNADLIAIFGVSSIVGTVGYRFFLSRQLGRQ